MKTNLTYLNEMAGGNLAIIKEMIDIFIEQVQEISIEMKKCLAGEDYVTLGKLAHKAKSSVSIMGMTDLSLNLKNLEYNAANKKEMESYPAIVKMFEDDCAIAILELNSYVQSK